MSVAVGMGRTAMDRQVETRGMLNSSVKFGLISLLAYGFSFGKSLVAAHYFGTSAERRLHPGGAAPQSAGHAVDGRFCHFVGSVTGCGVLPRPTMALVAPGFDAGKQMVAAGLLRWC